MKLVIISSAESVEDEHRKIFNLFLAGMKTLHIRKPKFSVFEMNRYIKRIPAKYHNKIVIHSHHLLALKYNLKGIHLTEKHRANVTFGLIRFSFFKMLRPGLQVSASYHTVKEIADLQSTRYKYVMLSPVFKSISKDTEKTLNMSRIQDSLRATKAKVIALGGIEADKIQRCHDVGFHGVAVLGAIWQAKDPVQVFKSIKELCKRQYHLLSVLPASMLPLVLERLPM